jgi:hypothetical protein
MVVTQEDKEILLENKKIILDITHGYKMDELRYYTTYTIEYIRLIRAQTGAVRVLEA